MEVKTRGDGRVEWYAVVGIALAPATGIGVMSSACRTAGERNASVEPDYVTENARARQRLELLVSSLEDEELGYLLPNGWTISQAFVHLAFWDFSSVSLLKRWQRGGFGTYSLDDESINEAILGIAGAVQPQEAGRLAVRAAAVVDAEVTCVPPELRATILAKGSERKIRRSLHRDEHLSKIEEAISRRRKS